MKVNDKYEQKIQEYSYQELLKELQSLEKNEDLSLFLDEPLKYITYYLYNSDEDVKYKVSYIPKKSGGRREICSPQKGLKRIQRKLNIVFQAIYSNSIPKPAHGFIKEKSIITNAKKHIGKKFVLNIDLQDFFPSVHFGRIKGLLQSEPFSLNNNAAASIANLCCYKGKLPQGSPTSPILTNLICLRLDKQLNRFARENNLTYTRYADDITFSCNEDIFPENFGKIIAKQRDEEFPFENLYPILSQIEEIEDFKITSKLNEKIIEEITVKFIKALAYNQKIEINKIIENRNIFIRYNENQIIIRNKVPAYQIILSKKLLDLVESNGFEVNLNKVRLQTSRYRQEVTGIKVNEKLNLNRSYVREIRAMLHSWKTQGIEKAEERYINSFRLLEKSRKIASNLFKSVVKGKIEFLGQVRGKQDSLYLTYKEQYDSLTNINKPSEDTVDDKINELRNEFISINLTQGNNQKESLKSLSDIKDKIKYFDFAVAEIFKQNHRYFFETKTLKDKIEFIEEYIELIDTQNQSGKNNQNDDGIRNFLYSQSEKIDRLADTLYHSLNSNRYEIREQLIQFEHLLNTKCEIKNDITAIKKENDYDVQPNEEFEDIEEENLRNELLSANKRMVKAMKRDDYFEFSRLGDMQFEGFINLIFNKSKEQISLEYEKHKDNVKSYIYEYAKFNDDISKSNNYQKRVLCFSFLIDDLSGYRIQKKPIKDINLCYLNHNHIRNTASHKDYSINCWIELIENEKGRKKAKEYVDKKDFDGFFKLTNECIKTLYKKFKEKQ